VKTLLEMLQMDETLRPSPNDLQVEWIHAIILGYTAALWKCDNKSIAIPTWATIS
jgi:hypothetical protein